MVNTTRPRFLGDDYQARVFWLQACRLFEPYSHVEKIGYEIGPKGFDDISVYYHTPVQDPESCQLICEDHFQIKFHIDYRGKVTWESLMDPEFVNAQSKSLLQKLRDACLNFSSNGPSFRLYFVTPWHLQEGDPLCELISCVDGALMLDKFLDGGKNRVFREVRKKWRDHLGLEVDENLRDLLSPLRLSIGYHTLNQLTMDLSRALHFVGLKPLDPAMSVNPYDDLLRKLIEAGRREFTRQDLYDTCKQEGLWVGRPAEKDVKWIGVRSFLKWAENMEDQTESMLCLVKEFRGRSIAEPSSWSRVVLPSAKEFVEKTVKPGYSYNLYLDTHCSIAFLCGYFLGTKSGADVAPVQRANEIQVWRVGSRPVADNLPKWRWSVETHSGTSHNVALALSVSNLVISDVREFIRASGLPVGRVIHGTVGQDPGHMAILDGSHAWALAEEVATMLKNRTLLERQNELHLFISAPNGFVFYLGRLARGFGKCVLYEYNYERNLPGDYCRSVSLDGSAID